MKGGLCMNRRLPKSFFEKDRPKIKNESKQHIFRIQYPKEVELGKKHIIFTMPPETKLKK